MDEKSTCFAGSHWDLGGYSLREASFPLADTPFFSAFLTILANKNPSPVAPKEVQGKATVSLLLFVPLQGKQLAILHTAGEAVECFKRPKNAHFQ